MKLLLYLKMSFKTKNKIKKKEDFDTRVTLEAKHVEKLEIFENNRILLIQKKNEARPGKMTTYDKVKINGFPKTT